ncbi:preprotein translocase subunit YajC [Haloferula sargassicola]|uniref:Sec translocon accessory complex subunit YajC n=1 Tax=Haloferula sargassicola TaxID=490096 RepID=A0ABP9UVH2_9BACT
MTMLLALQFLAADPAPKPGGGILSSQLLMPILLIVMFYFLLIRPQQKQRKELQARINSLKTGDRVITTAGIHALVHHIKDKTVTLKVAEGTMIEFDKQAIASVHKKDGAVTEDKVAETK